MFATLNELNAEIEPDAHVWSVTSASGNVWKGKASWAVHAFLAFHSQFPADAEMLIVRDVTDGIDAMTGLASDLHWTPAYLLESGNPPEFVAAYMKVQS